MRDFENVSFQKSFCSMSPASYPNMNSDLLERIKPQTHPNKLHVCRSYVAHQPSTEESDLKIRCVKLLKTYMITNMKTLTSFLLFFGYGGRDFQYFSCHCCDIYSSPGLMILYSISEV